MFEKSSFSDTFCALVLFSVLKSLYFVNKENDLIQILSALSYLDKRPNWTPLSPITITNQCITVN